MIGKARLSKWLVLLATGLVGAGPALAQDAQLGATDPAANYAKWPDHEIFTGTPVHYFGQFDPACLPVSHHYVWEPGSDLAAMEVTRNDCVSEYYDNIGAAAGRILTQERDAVVLAYSLPSPSAAQLALRFVDPANESLAAVLPYLAPRVPGGGDFFDIASADLDGVRALDGEYRDEVVVAYAETYPTFAIKVVVLSGASASESYAGLELMAIADGASTLDYDSLGTGAVRRVDAALAVTTGDFDGNGVHEIAVAYLSGPKALTLDIFRYTVTEFEVGPPTVSLERVGSSTASIASSSAYRYNQAVSLAAGDFDGDGRDELAVGTVHSSPTAQQVHMQLFRVGCQDDVDCGGKPLVVTQASDTVVYSAASVAVAWRVKLAAGLFKIDVPGGWGFNRRQLAVAHSAGSSVHIRTFSLPTTLTPPASTPLVITSVEQFWLAAGGFKGDRTGANPHWSLALSTWRSEGSYGTWGISTIQPNEAGGAPVLHGYRTAATQAPPTAGARMPLVAHDADGDSMYLGAPVRITVQGLVRTDFVLQEPPKHAYWDTVSKTVENVSRYDDFAITMFSSSGDEFSSSITDKSAWAIGGSVKASAAATAEAHVNVGIAKASGELSLEVAGKVGYDYDQNQSSYDSDYSSRTAFFSGRTDADDYIVGVIQTFDIWRYRIYGLGATDGMSPFFEIVLPGAYEAIGTEGDTGTDEGMGTYTGGLSVDWYQPRHENGNLLSYPKYVSGYMPPDLGSFAVPCTLADPACREDGTKSVTGLMLGPMQLAWDQTSNLPQGMGINFSQQSGGGTQRSYAHTLGESLDVKGTSKTTVGAGNKVVGGSATLALSVEFEAHNQNSWGGSETSDNKTTESTGITLLKRAGAQRQSYYFYPYVYTSTDGAIKATFAVDPISPNNLYGREFWLDEYGQTPDLALNLPARFYPTVNEYGKPYWAVTMSNVRKLMRGFFLRKSELDDVTGTYPALNGAAVNGDLVRVEARVYNYSVTQGVAAGARVCFEAAPYDGNTNKETGPRVPLQTTGLDHCTSLPALGPQELTTAAIVWDTAGYAPTYDQAYRIYVVLDPANQVEEKYETEAPDTQEYCEQKNLNDPSTIACVDPGQNNEGYGYATVTPTRRTAPRWGTPPGHVGMPRDAIAAINPRGVLVSGNVQAYIGKPLEIRITITSDTPGTDFSRVLVYDGHPDKGGQLIAGKEIFSGAERSSAWFEWVPTRFGPHRLYAKVLQDASDPAPGGNVGELKVEVIRAPQGPKPKR
jgi:hypothetical protein